MCVCERESLPISEAHLTIVYTYSQQESADPLMRCSVDHLHALMEVHNIIT